MIVFRTVAKAVVVSGVIGVAMGSAGISLGAAQERDATSIVLQTGSADDMRGVFSVFIFVAKNDALWNQLNEGIKSASLQPAASYAEADVILMLVPEGTGLEPDFGGPSPAAGSQLQTAPLTAAILRRRDEKTLAVVYQARFAANEVDVARDALLSRFIELVSAGKGLAPCHT